MGYTYTVAESATQESRARCEAPPLSSDAGFFMQAKEANLKLVLKPLSGGSAAGRLSWSLAKGTCVFLSRKIFLSWALLNVQGGQMTSGRRGARLEPSGRS